MLHFFLIELLFFSFITLYIPMKEVGLALLIEGKKNSAGTSWPNG